MANDECNISRSCWKQVTHVERPLSALTRILIFMVVVLTPASASIPQENKQHATQCENKSENICLSEGCVKTAAHVLQNMDQSVNPCDDFYQFACGGFIKETEIPATVTQVDTLSRTEEALSKQLRSILGEPPKPNELKPFALVKQLYNICLNHKTTEDDDLATAKDIFRDAGGWPILEGSSWNKTTFEWKESIKRFMKLGLKVDSFIKFDVTYDPSNSTRTILTLNQPLLYGKRNKSARDLGLYSYYEYLLLLALFFGVERKFAEKEVTNVINLDTEIAKIRSPYLSSNPITITELQNRYPSIQWLDFINSIIDRQDKTLSSNETVYVAVPQYVDDLLKLLSNTSKRDQANYMFFLAAEALMDVDYLLKQLDTEKCKDLTIRKLYFATAALYSRNYFHEDDRQKVLQIATNIKNEFVQIIKQLDWMDEATKKIAIEKASWMTVLTGYPVEFLDDKKLEDYYAKLNISSGSYVRAMNEFAIFNWDKKLSVLKDTINKTDWTQHSSYILYVGARSSRDQNGVEIPVGILQGIFFNKDRPNYMNYGAIGYVIGHEITHGFDNLGRHFDKEGNSINWWTDETEKGYMKKTQCIEDQYSAITVPEVGRNLNATKTEKENIADNSGIRAAYAAYSRWVKRNGAEPLLPGLNFTSKQMFWISAANTWCSKEQKQFLQDSIEMDTHSPARYRVLIPFANSGYFAEDFNCPVGSKMNPIHKCQVW